LESPLRRLAPEGLRLIETLRWTPGGGFARLDAHLRRLARGAAALDVAFAPARIDAALASVGGATPLRVRLTLGLDGAPEVETAPLPAPIACWRAAIACRRLRSDDPWLGLKTTRRAAYDAVRAALPEGLDEMILLNERGEVCDGTITTVFADLGDGLVTPPLACGLLPGVLREEMLARGECRERVLTGADLAAAASLFLGNALRGLAPAKLARGGAGRRA